MSDNLANKPRCQHIKDDGHRCGSFALRGHKLCYFHDRQRKTFPHRRPYRLAQFCRRADFFNVQTPDDVIRSCNQVMNAILSRQLSPKEAGAILFALQTATIFAPHTTATQAMRAAYSAVQRNDNDVPSLPHPSTNRGPQRSAGSMGCKSVADIFEMFPGLDDLKAMLTPEDIALVQQQASRSE